MSCILGLDISKETIDGFLLSERGEAWKQIANNSKGIEQLKRWLVNRHVRELHVCMEAYPEPITRTSLKRWQMLVSRECCQSIAGESILAEHVSRKTTTRSLC